MTASARICQQAPSFECTALLADQTFSKIRLADYAGHWLVLFFYPLDFTYVCPTEIWEFSDRANEFNAVDCQVVGASVDSQFTHLAWTNVARKKGGLAKLNIPLISDLTHELSRDFGVLLENDGHSCRGTFIIDPQGIIRHISMNDPPVGRNVSEVLRLVNGYQFADKFGQVCPAKWKPGKNSKTINPDPIKKLEYFESVNYEKENVNNGNNNKMEQDVELKKSALVVDI